MQVRCQQSQVGDQEPGLGEGLTRELLDARPCILHGRADRRARACHLFAHPFKGLGGLIRVLQEIRYLLSQFLGEPGQVLQGLGRAADAPAHRFAARRQRMGDDREIVENLFHGGAVLFVDDRAGLLGEAIQIGQ